LSRREKRRKGVVWALIVDEKFEFKGELRVPVKKWAEGCSGRHGFFQQHYEFGVSSAFFDLG
jgi:hypothetical protein